MARQPLSLMSIDWSLRLLTNKLHTKRNHKMEENKEVNIAFRLWDQITQLESILWKRYCDEFLNLTIEQIDKDLSQDDSQDVNDDFLNHL